MYEWLNCFELKDGQVSERIIVWIVGFDRPGALRLIQHNTGHMPLWVGSSIAFNTWRRSSLLFGVVKLDRTYVRLFRTCHHPYNICLHAIAVLCNPQFLWGICCDLWGNLATVLGSLAYCIVCQRSPRLVLLVQRERYIVSVWRCPTLALLVELCQLRWEWRPGLSGWCKCSCSRTWIAQPSWRMSDLIAWFEPEILWYW